MTEVSWSGRWEHDIALFTSSQQQRIEVLRQQVEGLEKMIKGEEV